jgi:hypothetical protein
MPPQVGPTMGGSQNTAVEAMCVPMPAQSEITWTVSGFVPAGQAHDPAEHTPHACS